MTNGVQQSLTDTEIIDEQYNDDSPVKSLKILAQICVDELQKCNETEMQAPLAAAKNDESIYISSDSESDTSFTGSAQRGVIVGGTRKSSCSESETSSENESSSDSSSSESDSSDDEDEDDDMETKESNLIQEQPKIKEISGEPLHEPNVPEETVCSEANDTAPVVEEDAVAEDAVEEVAVEDDVMEQIFNPNSLKDICKKVLQNHSMIIRYDVPTLKYLCEHTLASAGMEIPLICFVNEDDSYEYVSEDVHPLHDEGLFLCLDGEFDETELANLFNGAGNGACESVDPGSIEAGEGVIDKTSLIDQCVALQNILSSPPPEDNQAKVAIEVAANQTTFYMDANDYTINDEFHDSIQYEETVLPSENNSEDFLVAIESFKKYLQKKYVHPSCYHKLFVINKLLRKYKVHQVSCYNKKTTVQKRLQHTLSKLRKKSIEKRKPKKVATRRSARIADKIKQQKCDELDWKSFDTRMKSGKKNKNTKSDAGKCEAVENRNFCKIVNVHELIQSSGNKKTLTETDKESITRDILKLIAKKRTLKRKLSICQRPTFSFDDDGYCYDEDGQISEMLSSFINNSFDEQQLESSSMKKSRFRKSSIESKKVKEQEARRKKLLSITAKKESKIGDKSLKNDKPKKLHLQEKKPKKEISVENELASTRNIAINKTEKKSLFVAPILPFPTKASFKEIIPAKRTRFLSIDGSIMRYGAERKNLCSQVKSSKEKSECLETAKRKISHQKATCKKAVEIPLAKELTSESCEYKPKQIKERRSTELERSKPKLLDDTKQSVPFGQKSSLILAKTQVLSAKLKESGKNASIKDTNKIKEAQKAGQAVAKELTIEKNESKKYVPKAKPIQNSTFHKMHEENGVFRSIRSENVQASVECQFIHSKGNTREQNSTTKHSPKLSNNNQEKPLSQRNLCSTIVSPLKIIIEPRRINSPLLTKVWAVPKDPLAIDAKYQASPTIIESPAADKIEMHKPKLSQQPINFSKGLQIRENERSSTVRSLNFQSLPHPQSSIENRKTPVQENVDKKLSHAPTQSSTHTMLTKTDISGPMKFCLDIETLLPSTKIPQPRPARRCLARAQTISLTESPLKDDSMEPMKLRSSNELRNLSGSMPQKEPALYQFCLPLQIKQVDTPYTIPKRKQLPKTTSPPKNVLSLNVSNVQTKTVTPTQRTTIHAASYPDPDSLQIPSLDLRSPTSSHSPLEIPMAMLQIPKPKPLQVSPVENKETSIGKRIALPL